LVQRMTELVPAADAVVTIIPATRAAAAAAAAAAALYSQ